MINALHMLAICLAIQAISSGCRGKDEPRSRNQSAGEDPHKVPADFVVRDNGEGSHDGNLVIRIPDMSLNTGSEKDKPQELKLLANSDLNFALANAAEASRSCEYPGEEVVDTPANIACNGEVLEAYCIDDSLQTNLAELLQEINLYDDTGEIVATVRGAIPLGGDAATSLPTNTCKDLVINARFLENEKQYALGVTILARPIPESPRGFPVFGMASGTPLSFIVGGDVPQAIEMAVLRADITATVRIPEQQQPEPGSPVVDYVFTIDSSSSMRRELPSIQRHLSAFYDGLVNDGLMDFTLTVIAGDDATLTLPSRLHADTRVQKLDPGVDHPRGRRVPGGSGNLKGVGSNNSLGILASFLNGEFLPVGITRISSPTEVVFITEDEGGHIDGDELELDIGEFSAQLAGGDWGTIHFNGSIAKTDRSQNRCLRQRGDAYLTLAQQPSHEGFVQELCDSGGDVTNFDALLDHFRGKY